MSQEEMIGAMGEGDMEAFHLFYQDTARPVYSFILSLTRNPDEAEDVMQETYLTVWTKAGSYVPLEQAADRKVLLDALGRISREERQIVLLHAAAGMKHREVAEALQMPLATVLSKYNRSMKKLQELLRCTQ